MIIIILTILTIGKCDSSWLRARKRTLFSWPKLHILGHKSTQHKVLEVYTYILLSLTTAKFKNFQKLME